MANSHNNKNKTKRIVSGVIVIILILAKVVPMVAGTLVSVFQ